MECSKCGRKLSFIPFKNLGLWCKNCKMYICRKCFLKGSICPHCKKEAGKSMLFAISGTVLMLMIIGLSFFIIELPELIQDQQWQEMEVTNIEDLEVGEEVKIVGYLNSTEEEPISGYEKEVDDEWEWFKTAVNFYVEDKTGQIYVNMSDWKVIYSGRHTSENAEHTSGLIYLSGDKICIIGKTSLNETGQMVLNAEAVAPDSDRFSSNFIFVFYFAFVIVPIILLLISGLIAFRRIRLHNRNIQKVMIVPEQDVIEPFITDIEWHVNTGYKKMQQIGIISLVLGVIITIPLYHYQIIIFNYSEDFCFSVMILMLVFMWGAIFLWANRGTPVKIGFSDQGIHVQYRSESQAKNSLTFVKWDDIQEINPFTIFNDTSFTFKLKNDKTDYISSVSVDIGYMILKRFENIKGKKIKIKSQGKDQKVQWFENEYVKKHKVYGSILLSIGVLMTLLSMYLSYLYGMDSDGVFFLIMMAFLPLAIGVMEVSIYRQAPIKVGFSDDGFHVKYSGKISKDKFEFMAWAEIKEFNPPFSRMVNFIKKNGLIQKLDFVSPEVLNKILYFFEEYKAKFEHVKHRKEFPQDIRIEWDNNNYAKKIKLIIYAPLISIVVITAIMLILSFGLKLMDPFFIFIILLLASLVVVPLLIYFFEYSYAPIQLGFSDFGLLVKYRKKNQNPMLLEYVWWNDIAGIKELEDLDSFRSGDVLRKGEKYKYIVIFKKSGIHKILGPIDIELADKIQVKTK